MHICTWIIKSLQLFFIYRPFLQTVIWHLYTSKSVTVYNFILFSLKTILYNTQMTVFNTGKKKIIVTYKTIVKECLCLIPWTDNKLISLYLLNAQDDVFIVVNGPSGLLHLDFIERLSIHDWRVAFETHF